MRTVLKEGEEDSEQTGRKLGKIRTRQRKGEMRKKGDLLYGLSVT